MSWVPLDGVYSPSYFQYTAVVMRNYLALMIDKGRYWGDIPRGVLSEAKHFFALMELDTKNHEKNPPAASNAQLIATHILPGKKNYATVQEVDKRLKEYENFLDRFKNPFKLSSEDLKIIQELKIFFGYLGELGEEVTQMERHEEDYWWQRNGNGYLASRRY